MAGFPCNLWRIVSGTRLRQPDLASREFSCFINIKGFAIFLIAISCCVAKSYCDFFDITTEDGAFSVEGQCESWRLNVEIHNIQDWNVVPKYCEEYVSNYMLGGQYQLDTERVCREAKSFTETLKLQGDGKDAWIFDIDETALSNLPYYAENQFGAVPFNHLTWVEWETQAIAPALQPTLSLYNHLLESQWTVFFLTGRNEMRRNITIQNLLLSGYKGWSGLILRQEVDRGIPAKAFKSSKRIELEEQGYRIWGNMGDQWSDLTGPTVGERTFKIPNPMYYIA